MNPSTTPPSKFRPLFYNPGQLAPEQIENLFIARRDLFQNLVSDVVTEREDAAPQHHIIIGQRGMGKTTLLHRLAVELQKPPHRERFIPLTFPEEQHVMVERLSDFWLNALDALATALDLRKQPAAAQLLDRVVEQLPKQHNDEADLANACRRELTAQCHSLGLRPVLLLDNFPLLLRKLEAYQWDLRAFLQSSGAPIFVAAGLSMPESLGNYDSAFFDMFKARVLYNLTVEECREIYQTTAEREGRQDVIAMICSHEGRLKTLHILTGGNPRTVGLLYELFARGLGSDAWEDLRSLLDAMTPLYQSRLEQLSDKGQQIFAALALSWEPVLQQVIETQTQLPQGTVSSTLQRLEESGVVERVDIFGQKKLGWQVAERFFNIWFLMRFASRRTQGSIAALASFLELFYSPTELDGIARSLSGRDMDGEQAHYGLAVSRALGNSPLSRELCTHTQLQILQLREKIGSNIKDIFEIDLPSEVIDFFEFRDKTLPSLVPKNAQVDPKDFARQLVSCLFFLPVRSGFKRVGSLKKADVKSLMEVFRSAHESLVSQFDELAVTEIEQRLYRGLLTETGDAQQWKDALETTSSSRAAFLLARFIPINLLDTKEAACRKAVQLDETYALCWNELAMLLFKELERYEEAEAAFRMAIKQDNTFAWPWNNLGNLLTEKLGRHEESESALKRAIELDKDYALPWNGLGRLYSDTLGRYEEAESSFRMAIFLDGSFPHPWNALGSLLMNHTDRYVEAEAAFRTAIELDSSDPFSRNNLGYLLHSKLGRYEEAEEAYRSSINADEHFERAWNNLAKLLIDHLEKYEDAEVAIRKSITFKESDILWNRLGNLLADYLHKFEEADKCYRRSLELDSDNEAAKQNLVFLLRDQLGKNTEAEELLNEIEPDKSGFPEVISLQRASFALHKENLGDAKLNLQAALEKLDGKFNPNSVDDWYRTAAVWLDFGHGGAWHGVWEETGAARLFMPFAEAVRAHHLGDVRFLNNIPKEVQPAAREIFKEISYRRREKQPFTGKQQSKRPKSK